MACELNPDDITGSRFSGTLSFGYEKPVALSLVLIPVGMTGYRISFISTLPKWEWTVDDAFTGFIILWYHG